MITARAFAGKSYAVLGLARSGLAVVETLLASGATVYAWDRQQVPRSKVEGRAILADPLEMDLTGLHGVVVSPGVPLNTHPIAERARTAGVPVIGDIELFAQARAELPPHKVVGITGTNGKSTTTALVHHILRTAGVPSLMGGNIGLPILAQEPLPEGGVYVLELSSYQIDLTFSLNCEVAVLLNITPDHLDRYEGFEGYVASKARLFEMQSDGRFAVFTGADEASRQIAARHSREGWDLLRPEFARVAANSGRRWGDGVEQGAWPSLPGPHNRQNALAAAVTAEALNIDGADIVRALKSFPGLPHRMERVGEFRGVLFVNDSKATNPASTAPALAAYPPSPDKRLHWICGGLPKGDDLDECEPFFGNIACAYTIGEAGPLFADLLEPHMHVERCEMLCEAVSRAIAAAQPGDVVLLSPACASFDQFRDYETRGDAFRSIVAKLTGTDNPADDDRFTARSAA